MGSASSARTARAPEPRPYVCFDLPPRHGVVADVLRAVKGDVVSFLPHAG